MKCPIRFKKTDFDQRGSLGIGVRWVSANRKLVREISTPYRKHMVADREDLLQEALIAAFKAFSHPGKRQKRDCWRGTSSSTSGPNA